MTTLPHVLPFWIAGKQTTSAETFDVLSPFDGLVVASVAIPSDDQIDEAIAAAAAAAGPARAMTAFERATALDHISRRLAERSDELAEIITAENGKPIQWARGEVSRAVSTFRWAAEEARRFSGDLQRLDTDAASAGRMALVRRLPIGPVLAIAPFNFPLNLVAHKVAPAIAVGAPIVIKPADKTPIAALLLGEILAEADLPEGMFSVLPVSGPKTAELVADPRLPVVSFTGSETVGWDIKRNAWNKHVVLELGGNASVIVHEDWNDLKGAADRIALFAYSQAGQVCVSVQEVLVQRSIAEEFTGLLADSVRALAQGDPMDEKVQVGPVIDESSAARIESWIIDATDAGAEVLVGGERHGTLMAPTLLRGVPGEAKIATEEVFGPVLHINTYDELDDAFAKVNASRFGLQTGIYTTSIDNAFRAHSELEVGGVLVGEVPTYRADQMPYGGIKASGVGREGVRFTMEDFTEPHMLMFTGIPL